MEGPEKKVGRRRRLALIILAVSVCLAAIGFGLGIALNKHNASGTSSSSTPSGSGPKSGSTSGKSGSIVTFEDGTKFTYVNNFGGDWVMDPRQPFAPGGKAQSWSPRVGAEEWKWGTDIVRGVNLG